MVSDNPNLVRQLTLEKDASSTIARQKLAKLFLNKLYFYIETRKTKDLSVGAGVALERSVSEIKTQEGGPVSDQEIVLWLSNKEQIFRRRIIEQTVRCSSISPSSKAMAYVAAFKIPKKLSTLSTSDVQSMADDLQDCSDYFSDLAKKYRREFKKT